jgi:hypothetical protein
MVVEDESPSNVAGVEACHLSTQATYTRNAQAAGRTREGAEKR